MDGISDRLAGARKDWEDRKAAAAAFRAALCGKEDGLRDGERAWGLSPGVARARRRELESSCEYLSRLEAEADRAGSALTALERAAGRESGSSRRFR
ncbi:MAG: hypothetical protein JWP91_2160 [Fibrobacteres bacterium]|nr:hypothetical protein [Fibrobacterota bacterium]